MHQFSKVENIKQKLRAIDARPQIVSKPVSSSENEAGNPIAAEVPLQKAGTKKLKAKPRADPSIRKYLEGLPSECIAVIMK